MLFDMTANAIMLAKIGDEQGLDASANKTPIRKGNKNSPPFVFCGIFFTIDGKFISIILSKLSPSISITDEKIKITTGDATPVKALPVSAHITPIILSISDIPQEKESI